MDMKNGPSLLMPWDIPVHRMDLFLSQNYPGSVLCVVSMIIVHVQSIHGTVHQTVFGIFAHLGVLPVM